MTTAKVSGVSSSARRARLLGHARRIAGLMDARWNVPGTPIRVGLDPLIGLIPGIGDGAGLIASSLIVIIALRLGAPAGTIARMVVNVLLDAIVGTVPLLGDLFDLGFKANLRNVALLERHVNANDVEDGVS